MKGACSGGSVRDSKIIEPSLLIFFTIPRRNQFFPACGVMIPVIGDFHSPRSGVASGSLQKQDVARTWWLGSAEWKEQPLGWQEVSSAVSTIMMFCSAHNG